MGNLGVLRGALTQLTVESHSNGMMTNVRFLMGAPSGNQGLAVAATHEYVKSTMIFTKASALYSSSCQGDGQPPDITGTCSAATVSRVDSLLFSVLIATSLVISVDI